MLRTLTLVSLALVFAACPPKRRIQNGPWGEPKNAEELIKRLTLAEGTVVALEGDARLSVDAPQGAGAVPLFVAMHLPDYLHIEQLDFFNRPQSVLITQQGKFGLYDAQQAVYFQGPSSPDNLARFLPLVLPPHELAGLMSGRTPRIPYETARFTIDEERAVYVLTLSKGSIVQTLEIETPSFHIVRSTVVGTNAYNVEYGPIEQFGPAVLPRSVRLSAVGAKLDVQLTYKDIKVNQSPDMTLFDLSSPDGVKVIGVDEKGVPVDGGVP
jgi:hypothetical protein